MKKYELAHQLDMKLSAAAEYLTLANEQGYDPTVTQQVDARLDMVLNALNELHSAVRLLAQEHQETK